MLNKALFALPMLALALIAAKPAPVAAAGAEHRRAGRGRGRPANQLFLELSNGGTVVIVLRPDLAPHHVERIQTLVRQRLLQRPDLPPRDPRLHGPGRRSQGHRRGRLEPARPQGRVHRRCRSCAEPSARRAPTSPIRANSQFFIMFAPQSELDNNYTVFGRVIAGHGRGRRDRARRAAGRADEDREGATSAAKRARANARRPVRFRASARADRAAAGAAARLRAAAAGRGRRDLRSAGARPAANCCGPATCWCSTTPRSFPRSSKGERGEASIGATLHKREGPREWRAFLRNAKRARVGDTIEFGEGVSASVVEKAEDGSALLHFHGDEPVEAAARAGRADAAAALHRVASGAADEADRADYQTMFAREEGAVAAPTAALHFTPRLIEALDARGIGRETLTLHVGAGTFLPVKADDTGEHKMHAEWGRIDAATAERLNAVRASGGRLIAVGTTSLRLLESAGGRGRHRSSRSKATRRSSSRPAIASRRSTG